MSRMHRATITAYPRTNHSESAYEEELLQNRLACKYWNMQIEPDILAENGDPWMCLP